MAVVRVLVIALFAACTYQAPGASPGIADDDDQPMPDGPAPDTGQPACTDSDGDGVCNELDKCPGNDDGLDGDQDGIADGCDTWPCGEEPALPNAAVTVGDATWGATLSNVNFGGGRLKVATKDVDVALSFDFDIHDKSCPGNCIDQIEVGIIAGERQKCPFDQAVSKQNGANGSRATTLRTPNASGLYTVRYGLGQNFGCFSGGATDWWQQPEPPASHTIAILCIP